MTHAERRLARGREELERAEAALRRAGVLLSGNGALYEGAVATDQAHEIAVLNARLIPAPAPTPSSDALRGQRPEAGACLGCRVAGPEHGLDHRGLCVECRLEFEVAHVAVTRLIDSGTGVSRAAVEAL